MTGEIGFHASHEQFPPDRMLALAVRAEEAGFDAVASSDHLAPWLTRHGHSGLAWAWLGAAMARTRLPFGVVTVPGQRYHPAITAQGIATLGCLFPGRFTPALGSGEALNEHVTGDPWPDKPVRNQRLAECASVIRRLLAGERVSHDGLVRVDDAQVFSLPAVPPPLFAAALSPGSAREVGAWADGLITVGPDAATVRSVVSAFRETAGPDAPVHLQVHLSWADSRDAAERLALEHWPVNALTPEQTESLRTPEEFDRAVEPVTRADVTDSVLCTADAGVVRDRLDELFDCGAGRIYLHQVGPDQEGFVDTVGSRLLARR